MMFFFVCSLSIEDFIEIIGSHAFEHCDTIQQVQFSPYSKFHILLAIAHLHMNLLNQLKYQQEYNKFVVINHSILEIEYHNKIYCIVSQH